MYISKNNGQTEIEVAVKTYYPLILFFGLAAFTTTLFLVLSIVYLLFVKGAQLQMEMFGYLLWSPIFISITMWLFQGKETAIFNDSTITLLRSNGIIKFSRTLKLCEIKNIKPAKIDDSSDSSVDKGRESIKEQRRAIFFWYRMGKISFYYNDKNITFFNGLDKEQTEEVITEMTNEIKNRCRQTN